MTRNLYRLCRVPVRGAYFVIQTEAEASRAVDYLLASAVLGVDTETRPSFRKGCTNKVALLQVSTDDTCFLFRLNHIGVTESVKRLLQDENVLKVGLSLRDDFASLHKRGEFEPRAFLDLQDYVRAFGIEDMSLQKLYANIFGQKISKGQRLTNWGGGRADRGAETVCGYRCLGVHTVVSGTGNIERK